MTDDPFSDEANPTPAWRPSRREVAQGALAVTVLAMTSACATRRLACATRPGDREHCQARFCRYYAPGPALKEPGGA